MKRALFSVFAAIVACGGGVATSEPERRIDEPPTKTSSSSGVTSSSGYSSSGYSSSGYSSSSSSSSGVVIREPKVHRTAPQACAPGRSDYPPNAPDAGIDPSGFVKCTAHAQCTAGKNGRCTGNGHDGWQCTYDACDDDKGCAGTGGPVVCECEGGFRADNNVCLTESGCATDKDCGPTGYGWCSPTLGSCGHYAKTESYQCHTPSDECIDDADCTTYPFGGPGYCAYDKAIGHWKCSASECAG